MLTEHSSTRTLKPDDPNNADNSTQYGYYSVEGSSTMICDKFPRMVVETAPGPGTAAIMRQIQDRAAAILLQQNGKQFSYTIAGFGFSSSFCIPLVAVWAAHTPEFFKGLTLPTRFRRGEILSACSIPPHTGPFACCHFIARWSPAVCGPSASSRSHVRHPQPPSSSTYSLQ